MGCSLKVKNTYYYLLSIILISFLLIGFVSTVRGDEVTQIGFSPSQKFVLFGSDFSFAIMCTPTQPIKAYEFQLQFNPSYLEVLSVSEGDIFEGYPTFFNSGIIDNNEGVITNIYGLILGIGNVSDQGSLVSVSFHTKSNIGVSTLSLFNVGVTNEVGYLSIETQNGEIIIYDPASPHVILPLNPVNKSQNVAIGISELSVAIYDLESDTFDWMIYTSPNIGSNSGNNSLNGTRTCSISGLAYSTTYNWYVHCKDLSTGGWTNKSFWFRTVDKGYVPPGGNGGNNGVEGGVDENNPPSQPTRPVGQTSIKIGNVFSYSSSAMDTDEDLIRLKFDWGDGSQSDWSDYVSSNITVEMNHYWDIVSNYNIRVLAQDQNGENSTWSEPLEVIVSQINTTVFDIPPEDIPRIVEFVNISNITYSLIDLDNDGKIDLFYNQMTEINSSFSYLDDNSILIDLDGDGSWDYIYDFEQKILSIYSLVSEDSKSEISIINPWFLILISLVVLFGLIVLFRDKISLFIFKLRLSILQSKSSSLSHNKRLIFNARSIHFFSNPVDKKQHLYKDFKKLDENKKLKTKIYSFEEILPLNESFKTLKIGTDNYDSYSRMNPNPVSLLIKKIDDIDLLHDNILSKIDPILDAYDEGLSNVGISDIEREVDRLLIDRLLFERNLILH